MPESKPSPGERVGAKLVTDDGRVLWVGSFGEGLDTLNINLRWPEKRRRSR